MPWSSDHERRYPALTAWRNGDGPAVAALDEAAALLSTDGGATLWPAWLDETRLPAFLRALPDDAARSRWCDLAMDAVRRGGVTLETLFHQRVERHPEHVYLRAGDPGKPQEWTYASALRRCRALAAAVLRVAPRARVAIITPNGVDGALLDLGCLLHGILVTPLAPNTDADTLAWILERLEIDVIVSGGRDQHRHVADVLDTHEIAARHLLLDDVDHAPEGASPLGAVVAELSRQDVDKILAAQPRFGLDDVATVMFTSGSTGRPKGVTFSLLNLVSKRFARAAALPQVGDAEVLLCYLPLFHTFGRYLELLGMLFWGGTYVFTNNASRDTLLNLMPLVRPTGLISIPLRWQQIHDVCVRSLESGAAVGDEPAADLRAVVGDRLRWGLSAAGYLDPRTFRFFQRHGVELCSGFGMTEATGGITMTPPGDYVEDSVGVALPGVRLRLAEENELQITGPYVAGYLDEEKQPGDGRWLPTGDIFREREGGHLQIVDRLKDIYKNTRGQTVAPRIVEQKFTDVPGIARVFLVGDHRNYNVLLIVPDLEDPVMAEGPDTDAAREYFHHIVSAANSDLNRHERVVNFAVLDRDFSLEEGELTPKGSYRRKVIEEHFADAIAELYLTDSVKLPCGERTVRLPRWLYRDLGILETDVRATPDGLADKARGVELRVHDLGDGTVRIGDLAYEFGPGVLDLGVLARQPMLWVGNAELAAFCPVKEGWDAPLDPTNEHVALPLDLPGDPEAPPPAAPAPASAPADGRLARIHDLCAQMIRSRGETAVRALEALGRILELADHRTSELIRRRIETLARHPDMEVRCTAYRLLVLDEPVPRAETIRPKFLGSGLPFLDEETITRISRDVLEERRLEAFRRRLARYREGLPWPADRIMRDQFDRIFTLLAGFARNQPAFYGTVRDELVSWVLLPGDPAVAAMAERHVLELAAWFEDHLDRTLEWRGATDWHEKIAFQDGLSREEIRRLEDVLVGSTFLQQSLLLAADGEELDVRDVPRDGIWISRTAVRQGQRVYRMAINTTSGKHFDLLLVIWDRRTMEAHASHLKRTIYWLIKLGAYPDDEPSIPRFGCYREDMGALSLAFVGSLNVWERIREYASDRTTAPGLAREPNWRRLYIQAFAAFFRVWLHSGRRIVPGMITPMNVSVPEPDFRTGTKVLSLTGWTESTGPLSLVRPMLRHFYKQTEVNYPWTGKLLDLGWICDAAVEAMGLQEALPFLERLQADLVSDRLDGYRGRLAAQLDDQLRRLREQPYLSCALRGAIGRYRLWAETAGAAPVKAHLRQVEEMLRLYGLDRGSDLDRCLLYRHTYFHDTAAAVREAFDVFLQALFNHGDDPALRLVELSDLQAALTDDGQRRAFKRMVFPSSEEGGPELIAVGAEGERQVELHTHIHDKQGAEYTVREPHDPAEIGKLYRHFFKAGYHRTISQKDRFLVVVDAQEQVVGGISWQEVDRAVVHLNGIVVTTPLLGRGISSALIEDFCIRLSNLGYEAVKTLFVLRPFFERHGFSLDRRWGGLVRTLERNH
ncbi:MAG TPA: GNAT family N-acetyltransferase [Candidatus Krumholzibacteria bacterium]|nr:GNAT family N-acetyltransferase [Candidatus Krumholzibacteria bacterium]